MFQNFCNVVGDSNLAFNEHYKTNFLRNKNLNSLRKKIEFHLKKKSTQFWLKSLKRIIFHLQKLTTLKICLKVNKLKTEE